MQTLVEHLPALYTLGPTNSRGWQARLLGLSGLLTDDLPSQTPAARQHLHQLWNHWWRERDTLAGYQLPKTLWRFDGLRPANHPIRRLALRAHWLASDNFLDRLQTWLGTDSPKIKLAATFTEI